MSANVFCITPSSFQKEMLMTSAVPPRFIYSIFLPPPLLSLPPFPSLLCVQIRWMNIFVLRQLPHLNWEVCAAIVCTRRVGCVYDKKKKIKIQINVLTMTGALLKKERQTLPIMHFCAHLGHTGATNTTRCCRCSEWRCCPMFPHCVLWHIQLTLLDLEKFCCEKMLMTFILF